MKNVKEDVYSLTGDVGLTEGEERSGVYNKGRVEMFQQVC